ncbi:MAG: hypothetical protein COU69_00945 [Candidatus Pacebacteria bacterium CG10_big_fil_rev_8_21_14_0_10_56_10]|nr:MAG: hypothetical protein COU69_00945 [Candidatus Pacebacteria bacterium CG10_big_fil_rev_8_21_14_0_10_56_10]
MIFFPAVITWPSSTSSATDADQAGFTLIELLTVITLTVILALTASGMFIASLRSNSQSGVTQRVKSEGSYALGQMELLVRNSADVVANTAGQTCQTGMTELTIRSLDGQDTRFFVEDGKIASNSGVFLTSEAVELVGTPQFDCTPNADGSRKHININFTLRKDIPTLNANTETVQENFTTGVNLRSF